jgi:GNAT superfamily N-acetyltransferase
MNEHLSTVWNHLRIEPGTLADYAALRGFHYRAGPPGAVKRVFVAHYNGPGLGGDDAAHGMRAGVIVESLPSLGCALRTLALPERFHCGNRSLDAARLNQEMRTISRVIVHPIFRSVGLAVQLVQHLLMHAETPYVEALAAMGRVHPFFERAGMKTFDRPALPGAVRVLAAMERDGVRPLDLVDPERLHVSPFLRAEFRRFAGKDVAEPELIGVVRQRVLSQPVYYVWARAHAEA